MHVNNIFFNNSYNTSDADKMSIIKIWLGREGLHFVHTLMDAEKEACRTVEDLFSIFSDKFNSSIIKPYCPSSIVNLTDYQTKLWKNGWAG